jgi:hypothetical protein
VLLVGHGVEDETATGYGEDTGSRRGNKATAATDA